MGRESYAFPMIRLLLGLLLAGLASQTQAFGDRTAGEYLESCEKGEDADCNTIGHMLRYGIDVPKDEARARKLFAASCKRQSARGCYNLGSVYEGGAGVAVDLAAAAKLFEKSCGQGEITACANLAGMQLKGRGLPQAPAKARALYARMCATRLPPERLKSWDGKVVADCCHNLANLYERGVGGKEDAGEATRFYEKACALESENACSNLARFKANGPNRNPPRVMRRAYDRDGPTD